MHFNIEIREILSRVITVEADSLDDAIDIVNLQYKSSEIVLDWADFHNSVAISEFNPNIQNEKDELIQEIIAYLIGDEEKHFLESGKPNNHIYTKLIKLQKLDKM